jgi:predicted nuclease of predicted toxin-antitoxin system
VKLVLDENLSRAHAAALRSLGHDAIAIVEVRLSGASDEEVRRFAIEQNRVLVTLDADFANVIRFPPEGTPGVVRLKVHPPTEQRIRNAIRRAIDRLHDMELRGCLAVVAEDKIRIRRQRLGSV